MSRPLRIEYPGAYYHVMNRGAGHKAIYSHDGHRHIFLELLREINQMFSVETHAYCLMDNHYHLLLRTPLANLGRAMRHLNGVYTQRYNKSEKTDGSLFRGRYKAILVDADAYLLQVGRYIHRNPLEAQIVTQLADYPWSSYGVYMDKDKCPSWLEVKQTLDMIGQRNRYKRYRLFVESGNDDETKAFYEKKKIPPVLGHDAFIRDKMQAVIPDVETPDSRVMHQSLSLEQLVEIVARCYKIPVQSIHRSTRGRGQENLARSMAMYLSRKTLGRSLETIALYFGLSHYGSVSGANRRFEMRLEGDDALRRQLLRINKIISKQT
jgi:REP-associated tyrosine transposase